MLISYYILLMASSSIFTLYLVQFSEEDWRTTEQERDGMTQVATTPYQLTTCHDDIVAIPFPSIALRFLAKRFGLLAWFVSLPVSLPSAGRA